MNVLASVKTTDSLAVDRHGLIANPQRRLDVLVGQRHDDDEPNPGDEFNAADPSGIEWTGPKPLSGPTPADAMADLEAIEEALTRAAENNEGVLDEEAE